MRTPPRLARRSKALADHLPFAVATVVASMAHQLANLCVAKLAEVSWFVRTKEALTEPLCKRSVSHEDGGRSYWNQLSEAVDNMLCALVGRLRLHRQSVELDARRWIVIH